jgi:hypothetical protein
VIGAVIDLLALPQPLEHVAAHVEDPRVAALAAREQVTIEQAPVQRDAQWTEARSIFVLLTGSRSIVN